MRKLSEMDWNLFGLIWSAAFGGFAVANLLWAMDVEFEGWRYLLHGCSLVFHTVLGCWWFRRLKAVRCPDCHWPIAGKITVTLTRHRVDVL